VLTLALAAGAPIFRKRTCVLALVLQERPALKVEQCPLTVVLELLQETLRIRVVVQRQVMITAPLIGRA
jgi:hypothetical protein